MTLLPLPGALTEIKYWIILKSNPQLPSESIFTWLRQWAFSQPGISPGSCAEVDGLGLHLRALRFEKPGVLQMRAMIVVEDAWKRSLRLAQPQGSQERNFINQNAWIVCSHIFLWSEGFRPWTAFNVKVEKKEKEKYGWRKRTNYKEPWKNPGWKSEETQFILQNMICRPGKAHKGHWLELHVKCKKGCS